MYNYIQKIRLWLNYPRNNIHPSFKYGKGLIVDNYNVIEENVVVGDSCFVGHHNVIRPYLVMGNRSQIRSFCFIAGNVKLGNDVIIWQYGNIGMGTIIEDRVFVGAKTIIINTRKISKWRDVDFVCEPVYVEYGARIASGCFICPKVRIGHNSMIQAGSLVTKSTEPCGIYRGRPAVKIGEVPQEERI